MIVDKPEDSVLRVRRSIHIKAARERVWAEFTAFEKMDRWWGAKAGDPAAGTSQGQWLVEFEPRVGGRAVMAVDWNGERVRYGGTIKVFTTAREWTFENDWMPNRGWKEPTLMTVRLSPALEGTLVEGAG